MLILRDPLLINLIADPGLHELVALRFTQILAGEAYDYERHGYMVVVEPGDTVAQLEEETHLAILHGLFDDVPYGDPDFAPSFDFLEEHHDCYEILFIGNDDGFATTLFVPKAKGIDPGLLALCRSFATPAVTSP